MVGIIAWLSVPLSEAGEQDSERFCAGLLKKHITFAFPSWLTARQEMSWSAKNNNVMAHHLYSMVFVLQKATLELPATQPWHSRVTDVLGNL